MNTIMRTVPADMTTITGMTMRRRHLALYKIAGQSSGYIF